MASRSRAKCATLMTKANKTEVNYSRGMQNAHCGKSFRDDTNYCRHFISSSNSRTPNGDGSYGSRWHYQPRLLVPIIF